ncbi:MAG: PTS sugar transporter subunit IIA [Sporolactobacillus sp.]
MDDLLEKKLVFRNLDITDTNELFHMVGERMISLGFAKEGYVEELIKRETLFPTGVPVEPIGVAIPHTDGIFIKENKLAVVTLKHPITIEVMGSDHEKMAISLAIFIGVRNGKEHMIILQHLIEQIQDSNFVNQIMKADTNDEIYNIFYSNLKLEEIK